MRAKEIETKIKEDDVAIADPVQQHAPVQADVVGGSTGPGNGTPDHDNHITNVGKVPTDDPYTQTMLYPGQQELEMKKKEAGKDIENHDHVHQNSDEKGPHIPWDEPLVKQPETMDGEKPGLPSDMRKNTNASPMSTNAGQWSTKDSQTNLGSDTEKRVSDAEQMRQHIDKVAAQKRDQETKASAGASELSTKAGIPQSFGK